MQPFLFFTHPIIFDDERKTFLQMAGSVEILKRHYAGLVRASEAEKFYQP